MAASYTRYDMRFDAARLPRCVTGWDICIRHVRHHGQLPKKLRSFRDREGCLSLRKGFGLDLANALARRTELVVNRGAVSDWITFISQLRRRGKDFAAPVTIGLL